MLLYRENWVNSFIIPFILNACFSFKLRPSVCIGTSKQSLRNLKVTNHLLKGIIIQRWYPRKKKHSNHIQLFWGRLSAKLCTRQSGKVIWDMINTLFLTTVAVEPTFVAFPYHSKTHFHGLSLPILSNFFEQRTQNHPQCLSWLSRAFFPTTFLEIAVYSLVDSLHTNPRCVQLSDFFRFLFTLVLKSHWGF